MTADGWEQRFADLGQARELREEIVGSLAHHSWCKGYDADGTCICRRNRELDADALLSGPLAPLLASQAAVQRVETLAAELDREADRCSDIVARIALRDAANRARDVVAGVIP